ncbi:methylaspartate mutase subunit E [Vallitalea maricola]|uniref:Methylaspartate mutase subunit E n=1 Tax=Vallitalea maricola TaxID=3074433 RepID=A0ACB5UE62_9FIRM|nr:methylaspartate mutase subunit E [Vallitalea sp. AN17-2]
MELKNKKIDSKLFKTIQDEVLFQWSTGNEVDFEEAVKYHEAIPEHKIFSRKLSEASKLGNTLIQPRAGVALVDKHIELLNYLVDEGEADLLPTTIDSYTRHNRYNEAEKGINESRKAGRSLLNGFPAVNHGISLCRKVNESVNVPVEVRHGTPDARLLAEITIAGGFTSYEGGGISYNIPYSKNIPLDKTIYDWQYVDRLIGLYEEAGISINREPFGPLTGTLVPPCISHSVAIIESLLAAEQGVKNITVGYGQCGNLIQDVAAISTLKTLTEEYLQKLGYEDVIVTTVLHQWMGGFPEDESKAFGVISWGAATAALAGATKVIVKTPHEAMGVPTKEANASGIKATKQVVTMLRDQKMELTKELEEEKNIIKAETRCIIDKTIELGEGDIAVGTLRAFAAGVIDIPFAPSRQNAGKVFPARDNMGAVRFLECANIPFTKEIKDYHYSKMLERAKYEKRDMSFQMVIDDIYAIGKGRLVGRPR